MKYTIQNSKKSSALVLLMKFLQDTEPDVNIRTRRDKRTKPNQDMKQNVV